MTVTVKNKQDLVVPQRVRRQAGIKSGDRLEFRVSGGIISIIPGLPSANDQYTSAAPGHRRPELAAARKGPYHGPFSTADEAITFLKKEIRSRNLQSGNPLSLWRSFFLTVPSRL